jgi:hypothetical protein
MLRASDPKQIETVSFPARARHDTTGRLFFCCCLQASERKLRARSASACTATLVPTRRKLAAVPGAAPELDP